MGVIEFGSKHLHLNFSREKNTSLFCFIFPVALLILKSQMDPARLYLAVVTSDGEKLSGGSSSME